MKIISSLRVVFESVKTSASVGHKYNAADFFNTIVTISDSLSYILKHLGVNAEFICTSDDCI